MGTGQASVWALQAASGAHCQATARTVGIRRPLFVRLGAPPSERPPLLLLVLPPFFFRRFRAASCCCNKWFSRSVPPGLRLSCVAGPRTLVGEDRGAEGKASEARAAVHRAKCARQLTGCAGARRCGCSLPAASSRSAGRPVCATHGWRAGRGGGASGEG